MKKLFFLLIVVLCNATLFAQTTWNADPMHSNLSFSITHMGISDIDGLFNTFTASATTTKADFSDAVFELSTEVASINTQVEQRDKHLRSADFFDVEKYPKMTFKSTLIKKKSKNRYKLRGNLTMHGITKMVNLTLWYRGTVENPQSKAMISGFQISGTLKRSDFGIGSGFTEAMLSDFVKIKADCEFIKQ
ncbi:YceI family protein [Flavobacterium sp.]|uniref:YceI family protein n=1 Tax=Flavobacterium sp. TaxID=239 RepID=UPI002B4B08BB|nr:YceI family protein [Flavobacterium sp.]HLF50892.1 YceI family protein [Flavobacterium sp.]